jgi:hypothetical protein
MNPPGPDDSPPPPLAEVRFSLGELLREIKAERRAGSFAHEKLDRHEIRTIFKTRLRREKRAG